MVTQPARSDYSGGILAILRQPYASLAIKNKDAAGLGSVAQL